LAGLLDCPVPYYAIDSAHRGISSCSYGSGQTVKWLIDLESYYGSYATSFRHGIVVLENGDNIHMVNQSYVYHILKLDSSGNVIWSTEDVGEGYGGFNFDNTALINDQSELIVLLDDVFIKIDVDTGVIIKKVFLHEVFGDTFWGYEGPVLNPSNNDLYIQGRVGSYSDPINLYCFDSDLNYRWEVYRDNGFYTSPASVSIYNGLVYVFSSGYYNRSTKIWTSHPHLYAFDANGNEIYKSVDLDTYGDNQVNNKTITVTSSGLVLVGTDRDLYPSSPGQFVCFNSDCTIKWDTELGDYLYSEGGGCLSLDESTWYPLVSSGVIYSVDIATGSINGNYDCTQYVLDNIDSGFSPYVSGIPITDSSGKIIVNIMGNYEYKGYVFILNSDLSFNSVIEYGGWDYYVMPYNMAIGRDGTLYFDDYYSGYVFAIGGASAMTYVNCESAGMIQSANTRKIIRPIFNNIST
jgi:hypothetical protein